ncbi:MAG: bifunctional 5,10-methylenetetrahydrofolate dehydrogenase/5,10-methenyltetrahydrofolate cyclohydrolase [Clostridiales bacterium]|nr:bifunctional 5,10-methylenetetrahydrofolate dehydrogenase/5,10-methenyltetrahydrofolate cyclohydrolase [Clostridiales bacterium]
MAILLEGKKVAKALDERSCAEAAALIKAGVTPTLAIVRLGERADNAVYERAAVKRCESAGVSVKRLTLPQDAAQDELLAIIASVNNDSSIHGCLLLRPFPSSVDENAACAALAPAKDVDGVTSGSFAAVFSGGAGSAGFPPCTARACMEILSAYGIDPAGRKTVVVGRSLVVGKPVAMMLLQQNATVTICHSKTKDLAAVCREAEILIVAAGRRNLAGSAFFNANQTVIDVGINTGEDGRLCGDVDFAQAEPVVRAITPVPGGVGTVTTSVLALHTILAAANAK